MSIYDNILIDNFSTLEDNHRLEISFDIQQYLNKVSTYENFVFKKDTMLATLSLFMCEKMFAFNNPYYPTISFLTIDHQNEYKVESIFFNFETNQFFNPDILDSVLDNPKVFPILSFVTKNMLNHSLSVSYLKSSLNFNNYFKQIGIKITQFFQENNLSIDIKNSMIHNTIGIFKNILESVHHSDDSILRLPYTLYFQHENDLDNNNRINLLSSSLPEDLHKIFYLTNSSSLSIYHSILDGISQTLEYLVSNNEKEKYEISSLFNTIETTVIKTKQELNPFYSCFILCNHEINTIILETANKNHNIEDSSFQTYNQLSLFQSKLKNISNYLSQHFNSQKTEDFLNSKNLYTQELFTLKDNMLYPNFQSCDYSIPQCLSMDKYEYKDHEHGDTEIKKILKFKFDNYLINKYIFSDFLKKYNQLINSESNIELLNSIIPSIHNIEYRFDITTNELQISYCYPKHVQEINFEKLENLLINNFHHIQINPSNYSNLEVQNTRVTSKPFSLNDFFLYSGDLSNYQKLRFDVQKATPEIRQQYLNFLLENKSKKDISSPLKKKI